MARGGEVPFPGLRMEDGNDEHRSVSSGQREQDSSPLKQPGEAGLVSRREAGLPAWECGTTPPKRLGRMPYASIRRDCWQRGGLRRRYFKHRPSHVWSTSWRLWVQFKFDSWLHDVRAVLY